MYKLIICGNAETICDGYTDDRSSAWSEEIAAAYVEAAAEVIRRADGDVDYEVDSFFPHWHGGKHTIFRVAGKPWGYSAGGVVCHEEVCPQWVCDLCDAAEAAGVKAVEEYVATLEARHAIHLAEDEGLFYFWAATHVGGVASFVGKAWEDGAFVVDEEGNPALDCRGNSVAKYVVEELDQNNPAHVAQCQEWCAS